MRPPLRSLAYRVSRLADDDAALLDAALEVRGQLDGEERERLPAPAIAGASARHAFAWAVGVTSQDQPRLVVAGLLALMALPPLLAIAAWLGRL
ncbi:hypothetical protein [Chitinimonas koreensis]|uniref:hypothetical protein n=1 Tax=Chitinimonas koreensis TaxID=356302 RepID=UPI00048C4F57|nr:hypothetical protein [Chitinimonas koreensis]QNM95527.1 hypothetical protein H9L41_16875 [Chitinimonas koreensis]